MSACEKNCCSSTGIHDGLTFGSGRLDSMGYWEFPCRICAEAFDENQSALANQILSEKIAEGMLPLNAILFVNSLEWLQIPAWPYISTDIKKTTQEIQAKLNEEDKEWAEFEELFPELSAA